MTTTPCQRNPEAWVGKDANLRAAAANICRTLCPVFEECKAGTFGTPGPDDHGVWAGRDHTNDEPAPLGRACAVCGTLNRATTGRHPRTCPGCFETKPCATCGEPFKRTYHSQRSWAAAKFCGHRCANDGARGAA